jgi:hypothetical protein
MEKEVMEGLDLERFGWGRFEVCRDLFYPNIRNKTFIFTVPKMPVVRSALTHSVDKALVS